MQVKALQYAIREAERFIVKAKEAEDEMEHNEAERRLSLKRQEKDPLYIFREGIKARAACRRASMDLTRSLAELRRA